MDPILPALGAALWLGILTSISPCPLATNIVAISFVGNRLGQTRLVLASGALYTAGRMLAYSALGVLLVASVLSVPDLAQWLQKYMNRILGPVLIATGLLLLEIIRVNVRGSGVREGLQKRVEGSGIWGAGILGIVFALSFCPVSAALFFGSLVPLAIQQSSRVLVPAMYGLGTALPVIGFAVLMAFGARSLSAAYRNVARLEWWARRVTAVLFLGVGIYYTLIYNFGIMIG